MNSTNPILVSSSRNPNRLLSFMAGRAVKLGACLALAVAMFSHTARASYATSVLADGPLALWQLNETGDPSTGTLPAADSSGHGLAGTYGTTSITGIYGITAPQPPTYTGFANGQGALQTAAGDINSPVKLPILNLNTNTVTIAMWINPSGGQANFTGLLMNRVGSDAAGLGFGGNPVGGMPTLGYTWNNNNGNTYNFNSHLYPVVGTWQFTALVISSNSATLYLYYIDPNTSQPVLLSAVNSIAHTNEAFSSGATFLGSDVSGAAANNVFAGDISSASVFNSSLTPDQILALFAAGVGVNGFAAQITGQPQSQIVVSNSLAQLKATGISGTSPLTYQWQLNNTNVNLLADAANFSGANSNILTIQHVTANDVGSYHLQVNNSVGLTVSSNALLSIQSAALVGEWLNGSVAASNLLDVSGYSLATNHGAYAIGAGNYLFTNDVPPSKTGQSILFWDGLSGLAISNSSTLDASYDNTFDDVINHAFTISFWAKNWPSTWSPWVSKDGDFVTYPDFSTTAGWELRSWGSGPFASFTFRDLNVGINSFDGVSGDDMEPTNNAYASQDSGWHFYTGTFDGASGVRDLYVDGQLAAQNTNDVPYILAAAEHLAIGARDQPPGNSYNTGNWATNNMEMFDVRIYNYAISQTNVQQLYGVVPAAVTGQPVSKATFTNLSTKFSATVSGTQPVTYQWRLNGTNVNLLADAANFSGGNTNVLTILSVTPADAGAYSLVVSNAYGSATSSNALLAIETPALVGEWLSGAADFNEVSGHAPAGTHDGVAVGAQSYSFASDVPPYRSGQSLSFSAGSASGIAITNSSTSDPGYTNTFDGYVGTYLTVSMWVKGTFGAYSAGWPAFAVKNGESAGWQLRGDQWAAPGWTVRDGNAGTMFNGQNGGWDGPDDMSANAGFDNNWHLYTGTFNSISGYRALYIDGKLTVYETGNVPYFQASASHVTINCEDSGNGSYGGFTSPAFEYYDLRIYNYELSADQASQLYTTLPPGTPAQIGVQPPANITTADQGITVQINAQSGGSLPLTNQWTFNGVKLTNGTLPDGAIISGANSISLTIANVTTNEDGLFALVAANAFGSPAVSSDATLTVGTLTPVPAPATNLVGAWLTGTADLNDHSGHSPQGKHDGYGVNGSNARSSNYVFTNDVPPFAANSGGVALYLNGSTAIAISNSSTADAGYTNTFDDNLTNALTVEFWAKGVPGGWSGWLSKHGDVAGWQLRVNNSLIPDWTMQDTGGTDISSTLGNIDNNWHHYAGTFDSVSGIRNLYVDGVLAAQGTGSGALKMDANYPLCIGAEYANNYPNYNAYAPGAIFTGEIYGVKVYNTALSQEQVNSALVLAAATPAFTGRPVINGNKLVLNWSGGTLLQATNLTGPWIPAPGATSPYTNDITTTPRLFFKVSSP